MTEFETKLLNQLVILNSSMQILTSTILMTNGYITASDYLILQQKIQDNVDKLKVK